MRRHPIPWRGSSGVISVGLSISTVNLPTMNAGDFVGHVVVTTSPPGGSPSTPITLAGTDAAKFTLTNAGVYPCDLLVGASNIAAGTYHVTLSAS